MDHSIGLLWLSMGLKLKWYKRPAHNGETISSNLIGPTKY